MKVFIPELGTVLILAEPWTFNVINERRNAGLAVLMGQDASKGSYLPFGSTDNPVEDGHWGMRRVPVDPGTYTWPAGTELVVDRIYVRQGNETFSSVSFKARVGKKQYRFFAQLADVNNIQL